MWDDFISGHIPADQPQPFPAGTGVVISGTAMAAGGG